MLIGRDSITLDQALAVLRENDRFMVRKEGEEKKNVGGGLFSEGSNRGRTKDKGYQGRGNLMGGVTLVIKSVTIVRRRSTYK